MQYHVTQSKKAVSVNITVNSELMISVEDLELTPVGGLTGKVELLGESGNAGVLVFIANTSFMALTDYSGNFIINDVPVNTDGYQLIAMRGNHTTVWGTYTVTGGSVTDLGTLSLDITLSGNIGIQWKGSLDTAPYNPEINWAYYDIIQKKSFIWDGIAWRIIAQDGETVSSITWKGALSTAPANPEFNWAYYDITRKTSYIWDGGSWQILSKDGTDMESGTPVFFKLSDMSTWLSRQQGGYSPNNPVVLAYAGYESMTLLFDALDKAKRFVDINISLSSIREISSGEDNGRKYIISLVLPNPFNISPGTESNPAFKNFDNLESIFGIGVNIHNYAFAGLTSLRSVKFLNGGNILTGAFMGCINLTTVDMPINNINLYAFAGCVSLTSIKLNTNSDMGDGYIYENAFLGCTSLESVIIITNIISIRSRAFKDCTNLKSVYILTPHSNNPPSFQDDVFSGIARTARTVTLYIQSENLAYLPSYQYGANNSSGYFWDKDSPYRDNLTVLLSVIP